MNRYLLYLVMVPMTFMFMETSNSGVNIDINLGDQGQSSYYRSLSSYYRVGDDDVYFMRKRGIPDDRLAVIFQIASAANVPPSLVAKKYRSGMSLMELTRMFGLAPDIYYVPVKVRVDGPPYGKAYGYYRNRARKEWKYINLSNDDIINFSNLKFISGYYSVEPDVIIKKRSAGKNFKIINDEFEKDRKSRSKDNKGLYKPGNKNNNNGFNEKEMNKNKDRGNKKGSNAKRGGKKSKN